MIKQGLAILFLTFQLLFLQATNDSSKVRVGIKGGMGFSLLSDVSVYNERKYHTEFEYGGLFGVSLNKKMNRYFSFSTEVLMGYRRGGWLKDKDSLAVSVYWTKNGKLEYDTALYYYQDHKFSSIDIPLYLNLTLPFKKLKPFLYAGVVPSYLLYYRFEWDGWYDNDQIYELDKDLTPKINRFTTPFIAGAGCRGKWWTAEVRYDFVMRRQIIAYGEKLTTNNSSIFLVLGVEIGR